MILPCQVYSRLRKRIDEAFGWIKTVADLWDRVYLDLVEPAYIVFDDYGRGEFAFGAVNAGMDLEYARGTVSFTWAGFDERDEVNGTGAVELADDGILEIEISRHLDDGAVFKARRA